jgi:hypothetical protein
MFIVIIFVRFALKDVFLFKFLTFAFKKYIPNDLPLQEGKIRVYNRCKNHDLKAKNLVGPSTAYWNNMKSDEIPKVIEDLSKVEQRILSV